MADLKQTIHKLLQLITVNTASAQDAVLSRNAEGVVTERTIEALIQLIQNGINQNVELVQNKQNNLNPDLLNIKYPTITALLRATQFVWISDEILVTQVLRTYENNVYLLSTDVALPFTTVDIVQEIIDGKWIDIKNTDKFVKSISDTDYTLQATDSNFIISFTSDTPVNVSVNAGLPKNKRFEFRQLGLGTVTFVANSCTIRTRVEDSLSSSGQYSVFAMDTTGTIDESILYGSLLLL